MPMDGGENQPAQTSPQNPNQMPGYRIGAGQGQTPTTPAPNVPISYQRPPTSPPPRKPAIKNKRLWLLGLLVLFLLLGAIYLFYARPRIGNKLVIPDQQVTRGTVFIKEMRLGIPGGVVIKSPNRYNKPGQAIANSELLRPDVYTEFDIPLYDLPEEIRQEVAEAKVAFGILYKDADGDGRLDVGKDEPLRDLFGREIQVQFEFQYSGAN